MDDGSMQDNTQPVQGDAPVSDPTAPVPGSDVSPVPTEENSVPVEPTVVPEAPVVDPLTPAAPAEDAPADPAVGGDDTTNNTPAPEV